MGEVDLVGRVYDGMDFADLISDALERCLSISHEVQDTSQRPHVTFSTDLKTAEQRMMGSHPTVIHAPRSDNDRGSKLRSLLTFDPGFPLEDVSLMASGGM